MPAGGSVWRVRWKGGARVWLLVAALLTGCVSTRPPVPVSLAELPAERQARAEHNLQVFAAVWDLVNRKHFDPKYQGVDWRAAAAVYGPQAAAAPDDAALYRVLNGMLAPLNDSHTRAFSPRQTRERRSRSLARVGFGMVRIEGRWLVSEVLPDSPAEKAGVKPGWIITARNGAPLPERFDVRPEEGEAATWEFVDAADQPVILTLVAKKLSIAPRRIARELGEGFVYLRFDEFDADGRRWLSRELKRHAAAPGVVIDLRHNPGGETFSLGISIGEFFSRPVDCGTFISRTGVRTVKNSWQFGSANYRGQVVVLVDGATGSAAEIFSAALQDHGRATIVGRQTAGAVLASRFYRLPDGGNLQLSREDYVAPKGRRIEGAGIQPDVVVMPGLSDLRQGRDRDLEVALELLHRGSGRHRSRE